MSLSENIKRILELYKLEDDGLLTAPKGKIRETQKLNKQKLLERYKGGDEKLAGRAARNKHEIDVLIADLSRERELKNLNFFYMISFDSLLRLKSIYQYQIELLELQSRVEKNKK
ncbi:hypothetical protein [Aureispira anguillae]|uniref:Uncharacterized protein n=1 Tax=Aureispira anguillae TaxID=2864201 RepID=A0A916DTP9_9BACT|nr:hypothetical protein [Aureispira anguillae]BDS12711.1 hypothetical protein AsAng_0034360 [Aureispira anguillae]